MVSLVLALHIPLHMFRLTTIDEASAIVTLKIEGRIDSEGANILEQECRKHLHHQQTINLDCTSVTFVDQVGKDVLCRLGRDNVQILNCSMFLEELLRE